jgi:hypothetical protein
MEIRPIIDILDSLKDFAMITIEGVEPNTDDPQENALYELRCELASQLHDYVSTMEEVAQGNVPAGCKLADFEIKALQRLYTVTE